MVVPQMALKPRWKSANVSTGWLAQVAVRAKPKRNGVMMRCRRQNFTSVPQALSRGSANTHWNLSATMLSCPWSIWDSFRCLTSNTSKRSFGWITIKIHNKIKHLKVLTYDSENHFSDLLPEAVLDFLRQRTKVSSLKPVDGSWAILNELMPSRGIFIDFQDHIGHGGYIYHLQEMKTVDFDEENQIFRAIMTLPDTPPSLNEFNPTASFNSLPNVLVRTSAVTARSCWLTSGTLHWSWTPRPPSPQVMELLVVKLRLKKNFLIQKLFLY